MLPVNAPASFSDKQTLWNSVEINEKRSDAQLAREIEVALPQELPLEEHKKIIRAYCQQFVDAGMCVDFSIHDKHDGNPHCHIMLTMRALDENGKWLPKSHQEFELDENGERIRLPNGRWKSRKVDTVDWNSHENADRWRASWAETVNRFLEANQVPERIVRLDAYTLHELVQAIYVEAPDKSSGKRRQAIHIKYDGLGFIPLEELMK